MKEAEQAVGSWGLFHHGEAAALLGFHHGIQCVCGWEIRCELDEWSKGSKQDGLLRDGAHGRRCS